MRNSGNLSLSILYNSPLYYGLEKKILAKIIYIAYMKAITLPNTSILKKVLNSSALPRYGTSKLVRHLVLGNIQNTLTDYCINDSLSNFFYLVAINNSFNMNNFYEFFNFEHQSTSTFQSQKIPFAVGTLVNFIALF